MGESSLLEQAASEQILEQRVSSKLVFYEFIQSISDVGFFYI